MPVHICLKSPIKVYIMSAITSSPISTNIGANVWIGAQQIRDILSLEIRQEHAGHGHLILRCYQDQVQEEGAMIFDGAEKLLGQVAEIILLDRHHTSEKKLQSLFVITQVGFDHQELNEGVLVLEGYAPTIVLDNAPHYESFYRQNLTAVAKTVAKPLERVKSSIKSDPTLIPPSAISAGITKVPGTS